MARFCGKCGSPLNENGLCTKCGAQEIIEKTMAAEEAVQNTPQTIEQQQAIPVPEPVTSTVAQPSSKKNPHIKMIIIAAAAVVVIGVLVACAFIFHWFGLGKSGGGDLVTSQPHAFAETSYGKIYAGANLNNITEEPKKIEELVLKNKSGIPVNLFAPAVAKDGDAFYGRYSDDPGLYKITVTGEKSAEYEKWVTEEQLKDSVLGFRENYAFDISGFAAEGDYVYGFVYGSPEWATAHPELNYRIFSISKSGSNIEFVGGEDVRAAEFVLSDGWIYYVDNGYTYSEHMDYDSSRVGIYKIRTDGSGKTKLTGDFEGLSGEYENNHILGCAGALTIYGDKLYYVSLEDGESPLCRMNLDGSGKEKLTNQTVGKYSVDPSSDTVYFLSYKYGLASFDKYGLFKLSLGSDDVTKVTERMVNPNVSEFTYSDGYIYLVSESAGINNQGFRRLDVASGKAQILKLNDTSTVTYDEFGFEKREKGDITCWWEPNDNSDTL